MIAANDHALDFLDWADRSPGSIALADEGRALDYAGLRVRVMTWAARLGAMGIGPGDVAGVACDRSLDSVVAILAVLAAGAAYLPLDLGYPSTRLAQMVEDARPRAMLLRSSSATAELAGLGVAMFDIDAPATVEPLAAPVTVDASCAAYVLFTSGSTGRPKGAVLSRRALGHMVAWHLRHPRLAAPARTLQFATLGFDSSVRDLFATFATGGTLVLAGEADRRDPFRLLAMMREQRIERAFLPYVELRAIANAHAGGGPLPAALRDLMTGGEALAITPAIRRLFAELPDVVLYNEYGPTESCVFVTSKPLSGDSAAWPDRPDIGDPLDHVRLYVADDELRVLPDGSEGELLIGGESLADGYVHRPDLTAERFVRVRAGGECDERVYRSGDRVRREADGRLVFLGRADDQVKIAGYRVELGEVEAALAAHPLVAEAAVVAPAGAEGRRLVAHLVARPGAPVDSELLDVLKQHLAERLPAFARPQRLVLHDRLPLTPNGKADRQRLEAESVVAHAPAAATLPEHATAEQRILAAWRELLELPSLRAEDNVFDHGADSLRVMAVLPRLQALGVEGLSATRVYEFPTARQQAQALAGHAATQPAPLPVRGAQQRDALARLRDRHRKTNG